MIKVKTHKQSEGYCGPTSLRIVLDHFGEEHSEDYLAKLSRTTREDGVSARGLVLAATSLGFNAKVINKMSIRDLSELTNKGLPVIVNWTPRYLKEGHYSVVTGTDKTKIIIAEPYYGDIIKVKKKNFERQWYDDYVENEPSRDLILRRGIIISPKYLIIPNSSN